MSDRNQTTCTNPATGEVIGSSPLHDLDELKAALERSRKAQKAWARTPVRERAKALFRIRDYIVERADELADIISKDNGKTRADAMIAEIVPAAAAADYYARNAPRFLRDRRLKPGVLLLANKASKIVRVPFGVVAVVSPWNYPFSIPFSEVVMALVAGNGVLLKTATQTQMVGRALERTILAGGLPDGLFSFLNLPGRLAGDALLEAGIDKLFFTGSVPVGKKLMAKAAETLTPVSLELGGNDAMLVCDDADLDRAALGAVWAGMQNAGQSCGGVERIYVHEDVYEPFMAKLKARVEALRVGPDVDFNVDIGAITTNGQADTIRRHIDEAVAAGATIFAQAKIPEETKGIFVAPTVLTDVTHDMTVMREETFGPVLGVMKVRDMDEAVELANDSNLGLTGSVWTRSRTRGELLARRIQAGAVLLNDHLMSHGLAETPWGGFKESGIGRTHGDIGFAEMTEPQVIVHDYMPGVKKNVWWHPHSKDVYDGMKGLLNMLYDGGSGRLSGVRNLLSVFPRTFKQED
jgi:succinate-semialdehyde dehydrogenase/glutarate-semialdehyde dehydrogenase